MKKKYVIPATEYYQLELFEMINASNTTSLNTGAEWGGSGEYAPDDWINEGQEGGNTGGYTTTPIEDDDDDLPSRGKAWGDLWDWD